MKSKLLIEKFKVFVNKTIQRNKMAWRSKGKDNEELVNQLERMFHFTILMFVFIIYIRTSEQSLPFV